jgi:phosphonate transport system substrate-binding protein
MTPRKFALTLGTMVLLAAGMESPPARAEAQEIKFGSVAMDIPAEMHRRLKPLTKYLTDSLQVPVSLRLSPDMPNAIKEVSTAAVDLSYLTPVAYIKAKAKGDVQLIAKTVTQGQGSFQLMIVVRADSPIKQVEDLAGKTFAFGDVAAILQRAVVVGAGMPLEKLGEYKFIGHYDNIARGVKNGDFDAGILKDTTAFKWEKDGLRILHASAPLPPYNIVASSKMDAKMVEKVRAAFLKLDGKNPEHEAVIHALDASYNGFAATSDKEYDVVRQLVAPFEKK